MDRCPWPALTSARKDSWVNEVGLETMCQGAGRRERRKRKRHWEPVLVVGEPHRQRAGLSGATLDMGALRALHGAGWLVKRSAKAPGR